MAFEDPSEATFAVFARSHPTALQAAIATSFFPEDLSTLVLRSLNELTRMRVFTLGPDQLLRGPQGIATLEPIDSKLMQLINIAITRMSDAEWFVLLTAAASVCGPALPPTVASEAFELAHAASALSQTRVTAWRLRRLESRGPTRWHLQWLDRLIGCALMLQRVRTIKRRLEKEQSFYFLESTKLLDFEFTDDVFADRKSIEIETAIARFDDKLGNDPGGGAPLGVTGVAKPCGANAADSVMVWFNAFQQPATEWFDGDANDPFFAQTVSLQENFPAAYETGQARPIRIDVLTALLNFSSAPIVRNGSSGTWSRSGYVRLPIDPFFDKILDSLSDCGHHAKDVVDEIRASRTVYRVGGDVIIDLARATLELPEAHNRPRDGAGANRWGRRFEQEVQEMIDQTPWKPSQRVRTLVGKKVKRLDGTNLTDIDAVAFRHGVLVLIDAKSYQFKRETRIGKHAAVRRMREKVEKASVDWAENVAYLSSHRDALALGDLHVSEIHGLVVLPGTPFVMDGPAIEEVLGLYRACSVHELRARLQVGP